VKALILASEFLESEVCDLMQAVSHALVRGFVALPFVASDDGAAAGEPTECFNPDAAVMRAESWPAAKRMTLARMCGR
jgi:hypothetical protein